MVEVQRIAARQLEEVIGPAAADRGDGFRFASAPEEPDAPGRSMAATRPQVVPEEPFRFDGGGGIAPWLWTALGTIGLVVLCLSIGATWVLLWGVGLILAVLGSVFG